MVEGPTGIGTVTFLFTDLVGSTDLLDKLGDDEAERLRQAHFQLLRRAVATLRGQEVKSLGDGLMVVFASAVDALACAVAMQEAVQRHNEDADESRSLQVRVGLHVGEPSGDEGDYFGTPVVVAKRLCDSAQGGRILVSELVRAVVGSRGGYTFRDLGPLALKGFAEPLAACEVVWEPGGWIDVEARGLRKLWANKAFRAAAVVVALGVIGGATTGGFFLSGAVGGSGSPAGAAYRELNYRLVNGTGSFQVVSGDCQSSDIIFRGTASNDVSGDISGHMTFSGDGILYVSDRCQWGATPGTFTITDQGGNTLSGVSDFPLHYGTSPSAGPAVQDPAAPMAFIYTGGTGIYEGATGRARCLGPVALTAQRGSSTAVAISAQSAYEKDCTSQVALAGASADVGPVILEMAAGVVKMAVFASPVALPKKAYFAVLYFNTRDQIQTGLSLKLRVPKGAELRAATRDEKDPATGERVWALPDLAPREVGHFVFSVTFLSAKTDTVGLVAEIDGDGFDPVRSDPIAIEVVQ